MVERGQSVIDSIARLESSRKPADLISARVYRELFLTEGKFLIRTLQGSGIDPNGPDQLNLNAVGFAASPDCNIDSLVSREHFFDQTERSEETRRLHRDMVARVVNSRSLPLETCMAVAPIALDRLKKEGMITLGAIILGIKAQSKEPTVQILFPKFYKDIATIEDKSKFALGMAIFFLHGLI